MTTYSDEVKTKLGDYNLAEPTVTILQYPNDHHEGGGDYDLFNPHTLPSSILADNDEPTKAKAVIIIYKATEWREKLTNGSWWCIGSGILEIWATSEPYLDLALGELNDIAEDTTDSSFVITRPHPHVTENIWYATVDFEWRRIVAFS